MADFGTNSLTYPKVTRWGSGCWYYCYCCFFLHKIYWFSDAAGPIYVPFILYSTRNIYPDTKKKPSPSDFTTVCSRQAVLKNGHFSIHTPKLLSNISTSRFAYETTQCTRNCKTLLELWNAYLINSTENVVFRVMGTLHEHRTPPLVNLMANNNVRGWQYEIMVFFFHFSFFSFLGLTNMFGFGLVRCVRSRKLVMAVMIIYKKAISQMIDQSISITWPGNNFFFLRGNCWASTKKM